MLIEMFLEWIQNNQKRLYACGIDKIEIEQNPDWDNPNLLHSACVLFWTSKNVGSITIWQVGHFDILVNNQNNDLLFSDSMFLEINKTEGDGDGVGRKKIVVSHNTFEKILTPFFETLIPNQP
jgi:hypothetical protein